MKTLRTLGCLGLLVALSLQLSFVALDPAVNGVGHGIAGIFAGIFLGCAGWIGWAAWWTSITTPGHGR